MNEYSTFLRSKVPVVPPCGFPDPPALSEHLFAFQQAVTRWALQRGRAALWLDTGLGKSRCAIEWARVVCELTGGRVIIFTPLAVAQQFVREGEQIGMTVTLVREAADVAATGIFVTNYDRLERFASLDWSGVVLDESSILKDQTSATRNALIEAFRFTPYRLACSATPAPNDHTELGNHAEFLGVTTRNEMLAEFFVHDGSQTQDWRLKRHAEADFWQWVAGWAMAIRSPRDIGFDGERYDLPPLEIVEHVLDNDPSLARDNGMLFAYEAKTLTEIRSARKASLSDRVAHVATMVNASHDPWVVWCDLNDESTQLAKAIPDSVEVFGSLDPDEKERRIMRFVDREARVLVTKPSIAGAGLNLQHCSNMAFAGLSFSWEQFYQAIRRCYRFGQSRIVRTHVVTTEAEASVLRSIKRKQGQADAMAEGMIEHMRATMMAALGESARREDGGYHPRVRMRFPKWLREEKVQ